MELAPGATEHGFTVVTCTDLPEIEGQSILMRHDESGARLLYLKNDDSNKAFAIGFRTPPADDTGVFHILEHSVLCGSDKFPVKEPFVDLLKGSMQTFLNAMTFPDKTLYPVASTNEQDLFNLMDVYLDAVFHPQIYRKRAIFEQEGWHFELKAKPDAPQDADPATLPCEQTALMYNGVVYNEMKGALSDANSVLFDEIQAALFPDTPYAFESGGTPKSIPTLTYEGFLDEHRRHYRTDNSYITLYGNVDIDRALAFLDEAYLHPVAAEQRADDGRRISEGLEPLRPRNLSFQSAVCPDMRKRPMDTAPENACAGVGYVLGSFTDHERVMATDILLDALLGSNEAPLKRRLLDAGIGHDVSSFVVNECLQPFVIIQVNRPAPEVGANLEQIIADTVTQLLDEGLDHAVVEASLSHAEFRRRENLTGIADGVSYAINAMSSWLYDDDCPDAYLRYEEQFATLRAQLDAGYFEELARGLFVECGHRAVVEVVPDENADNGLALEELARMNEELSAEEREQIVAEEQVLRELQSAPDSPEAQATLPRLTRADIGEAPEMPAYGLDESTPVPCLRHEVATRGIVYAYRYFDASVVPFEELPYLVVLALVGGKLSTAHHTAAELDTIVQGKLGNLTLFTEIYEDADDIDDFKLKFVVAGSALSDNVDVLAKLPVEVMRETDYTDTAKILDVLKQHKIAMEQLFSSSGHALALSRVRSYCTPAGVVNDELAGVGFYRFLANLVEHYDDLSDGLVAKLQELSRRVFADSRCTMSFAGAEDDYRKFWEADPCCGVGDAEQRQLEVPAPMVRNEAFVVPSDVCFAALGWDRRLLGEPYSGTWLVVARAVSYDRLWNEVRVKGGAYGTGFQATRVGALRFYSYRDPRLDETMERFVEVADWLEAFAPSDEDMEGFIVATVAGLDAPVKPRSLVRRQASQFFGNFAPAERLRLRNQVIATEPADVRALAGVVREATAKDARCVFGSREIVESSQADYTVVDLLA